METDMDRRFKEEKMKMILKHQKRWSIYNRKMQIKWCLSSYFSPSDWQRFEFNICACYRQPVLSSISDKNIKC